ncbi:NAD(P)-dependent dehydrogenase (short-subunit alcohol dehydrogenase family) [Kushneria sinocarnis]|uniref:NAD(P)-dependent dehydrogenase (Short-subunit alcohol dehydrogenase family) n=1 Tax=Kushneria sinocarnis TaxID=595502 RepID=A0A420WUB9_9GAMM|nr:SDR family NAD(P)-dependent oxidoreductase [Kushneria sinocarnis]RKQ97049.1 NAD(P)-dependent dehydrogenase (short-subunit alcohol dehydrogenase family) [Kushneria sinocarnis]
MLEQLPDDYTALITGGGGIARALLRVLSRDPRPARLLLATRHLPTDDEHGSLPDDRRLEIIEADVTREAGLETLRDTLGDAPVHLLFNTIGVLHQQQSGTPALWPEKRLEDMSFDALLHSFHVNAATAAMLLATLHRNLMRHPVIVASLSARVGSISDNGFGGWYSYRAAKAAHNMLMKTAAIELGRRNRRAIVLCLHPGTTDTRLSQPFQARVPAGKLFSTDFVADRLLQVLSARTPEDTGSFRDWNDQPIEW